METNRLAVAPVTLVANPGSPGGKVGFVEVTKPVEPAYSGSLKDWLRVNVTDPLGMTAEKMATDPLGSVKTATDYYGIDIPKYGIYIVLFLIIIVAILGLVLPDIARAEGG